MAWPKELDQYVKEGLSRDESGEDIRTAVEIIVNARVEYRKRKSTEINDYEVVLMALCFPIPGGPPKKSEYHTAALEFRQKVVRGSASSATKQAQISNSVQELLKRIDRDRFGYPDFQKFFSIEKLGSPEGASGV